MTPDAKRWLIEIKNDPKFKQVIREFKEFRPVIPHYKPQVSLEASAQLMEQIKYESARQDGFDLIYARLTGERTDG